MGLTTASTGISAVQESSLVPLGRSKNANERVIALAGNPNVGKSTVFNALTGLNQHTGNWAGKTVSIAQGKYTFKETDYIIVDLPGTYSLMAHSAEEKIARDFICFGGADAVVVVCDATCLERNMNLVLQALEITPNVVVCVNLMDQAKQRGIRIDLNRLSESLGVPVVGTSARSGKGISSLCEAVEDIHPKAPFKMRYTYTQPIESAIALVEAQIAPILGDRINSRWVALRLLNSDEALVSTLAEFLGFNLMEDAQVAKAVNAALEALEAQGITQQVLSDRIVSCIVITAEGICLDVVSPSQGCVRARDRKLDRILTSRLTGIPIMIAALCAVLWITITGANYPSQLLSDGLFWVEGRLTDAFMFFGAPSWVHGALVLGVYRTLAWVVSVMLPPMAIFFPLFTLLEDFGYLPRVAFNLDHFFKKAGSCGKQALTM